MLCVMYSLSKVMVYVSRVNYPVSRKTYILCHGKRDMSCVEGKGVCSVLRGKGYVLS